MNKIDSTEMPFYCVDCDQDLDETTGATIKGTSMRYGVYYEGDPICHTCRDIRYEDHIREYERENIELI